LEDKMYVKDLSKGIKIGRICKIGGTTIYLIRIHPELSFWQNVLISIPLANIEEYPKSKLSFQEVDMRKENLTKHNNNPKKVCSNCILSEKYRANCPDINTKNRTVCYLFESKKGYNNPKKVCNCDCGCEQEVTYFNTQCPECAFEHR